MIDFVEYGIVMGNGEEALKASADFVTKDANDNGVIFALKHFNLISGA